MIGEKKPLQGARTCGLRSNAEFQPREPPIWPRFFVFNHHTYIRTHQLGPNCRIAPEDPVQIEVDDVISIAVPSLFLMYPTPLLLIYTDALLTTWVVTTPSSPHMDFTADQQIHVIPDFASTTKSFNFH